MQWKITIAPWVIQDGNYKDFKRGQIAEFALEFAYKKLEPAQVKTRSVELTSNSRYCYNVTAEVVYFQEKVWVLDFGLKVYSGTKRVQEQPIGQYLEGDLDLQIDPFFYYEWHNKLPAIPPLIYTWQIDRIEQQTAILVYTKDENGINIGRASPETIQNEEIERTDARGDVRTNKRRVMDYILYCTKLDVAPKYQLTTGGL
jgi:hypothetical protein